MINDGQSNDTFEGNPRALDEGQASDGQSRENPLASDEDDASWTTVVKKSKKSKPRSQVQNISSNPVGKNTGAPGVSSSQTRSQSNNSSPSASSSAAMSTMPRVPSSSQTKPQSNNSNRGASSSAAMSTVPRVPSSSQTRPQSNNSNRGASSSAAMSTVPRVPSSSQTRPQSNVPSSFAAGTRTVPRGSTSSNTQTNPTVDLCCNHFEVELLKQPLPTFYQYHVKINSKRYSFKTPEVIELSEVKSKGLKRKIFSALREAKPELSECAYNGASEVYSTLRLSDILNDGPNEVRLPRNVRNSDWILPENHAEILRQPEELVYEVTIELQSRSNPSDGNSFPNQHTDHGEPGPDDKIFLQALSIFLHDCSTKSHPEGVCVRSNYYVPDENARENIGNNVVVWRGFHSSLKLTYAAPHDDLPRLVLNFSDVTTAVLVSQSVEDFIGDLLWTNYGRNDIDLITAHEARNMVDTALSGVRVQTKSLKYLRRYTIRELTSITSIDHSFKRNEDGEEVNVREHFLSQHGYTLRHPQWPLLCMHGGKNGPVYIPIEVCTIVHGQRYMRFSPEQRTRFLNLGEISPGEKKTKIETSLNDTAATYEAQDEPLDNSFKLRIRRSMINVEGQVLAAPTLYFLNGSAMNISSHDPGQWNFRTQKMANPVTLEHEKWAVYVFFNGQNVVDQSGASYPIEVCQGNYLALHLRNMCKKMGMVVNEKIPPYWYETREVAYDGNRKRNPYVRIQHMFDKVELSRNLIVAVLPSKSPDLYVPLKRICETRADGRRMVITQCVIMEKRTWLSQNFLANLALKINLKMGGSNSNVKLESVLGDTRTCIFGIDVSHGSTKDTGKPSIAAVVASVENKIWSRYAPQVREQAANQENVEKLQEMVVALLEEFHENHRHYPGQIIVYRDGLSESQFDTVGKNELEQFEKAWAVVEGRNRGKIPREIPITFIVVQKRHHTRFFKRREDETFENMAPGTVVTSQVCQTQNEDFYLCSHQSFITDHTGGPRVTSRPAHYTVLRDKIELGQIKIQTLTNYLCYCFGRATTAVSIPAPVYYAHVAAKHYSYFINNDAAGREPTLANINDKLTKKPYRMFYI